MLAGILACGPSVPANPMPPPEAEAVRKYILEADYPELFQGAHYRTRIENLIVADVDNDGRDDVTVQFLPHYRQSATVVFYRVSESMNVTRVVEGLAPGPLQAVSGDFLDTHALGLGVDFSIDDSEVSDEAVDSVRRHALEQFGSLVAYANFFHADSRAGNGAFIDLTHIQDLPASKNCESFEFSRIKGTAVGQLKGRDQNYLAAWVGDEIYIYLIRAFRDDGLLEKDSWVRMAPAGFLGFQPGRGLTYLTLSGSEDTLDFELQSE